MSTKTGPLVLLMFTVLCALPAAAAVGVIPSAFAQEEEEDDDDTNTERAVPIIDQDQGAANLGANLAANLDIEHIIEEARPTPTPPEEEPPEFVAFCFQSPQFPFALCFDTFEDCADSQEAVEAGGTTISDMCKGVVTLPPNAADCTPDRNEEGEITIIVCDDFPDGDS
jgi:hypothetical protein